MEKGGDRKAGGKLEKYVALRAIHLPGPLKEDSWAKMGKGRGQGRPMFSASAHSP